MTADALHHSLVSRLHSRHTDVQQWKEQHFAKAVSGLKAEHEALRHQLGYVQRWWKALLPGTTFSPFAQINLHQDIFAQCASLMDAPKHTQI